MIRNRQENSYVRPDINLIDDFSDILEDNKINNVSIDRFKNNFENISLEILQKKEISIQIKSKELEDIIPLQKFKRTFSLPDIKGLSQLDLEREACQQRDGFLWKCIGRRRTSFEGYIYLFQIRPEFDDVSKSGSINAAKNIREKRDEIFPAVERSASYLIQKTSIGAFQLNGLHFLGYKAWKTDNSVFMELPDREALLSLYQKYKRKHPEKNLPEFDIVSSEGIADDLSFVEIHFQKSVLSTGCEFIHDHLVHIIIRLKAALLGIDLYKIFEKRLIQQTYSLYRKIYLATQYNPDLVKNSELLNFLQGMMTDTLFATEISHIFSMTLELFEGPSDKLAKNVAGNIIQHVCDIEWQRYMDKRFSAEERMGGNLIQLFEKINEAMQKFEESKSISLSKQSTDEFKTFIQILIRKYPLIFFKLHKIGLFAKDLEVLDEKFVKWMVNHEDKFFKLANGLIRPTDILKLSLSQQKCIRKSYNQLEELSSNYSLSDLLTLHEKYPKDTKFNETFWSLELSTQKIILENLEFLNGCEKIGIFLGDFLNIDKKNAFIQDFLINKSNVVNQFYNKRISLVKLSPLAKKFAIENPEFAFELISKKISLNFLLNLSDDARKVVCNNPNRLERLLKADITYNKILALSATNQKNLILYSESLMSDVTKNSSIKGLARLAQKGPLQNERRYAKLVNEVQRICKQYILLLL